MSSNKEKYYAKAREWKRNNKERCREYITQWRERNREHCLSYGREYNTRNLEARRTDCRLRARRNAPQMREQHKIYRQNNREALVIYRREYGIRNRAKKQARHKARMARDPGYKMGYRLRISLNDKLKKARAHGHKSASALKLLGCSIESFILYIESKWEPGMSWDNYGLNGWHIDHIMPCAIFDLTKPEHQRRCFHFSNLQPLWAKDNLRKRDKVLSDQFNLL